MENKNRKALTQTLALGLISGLRATFAPALISHFLHRDPSKDLEDTKLAFIQSPAAAGITKGLAALEITGDKLPFTPNRIVPSQLGARIASGAFAGAVIFKSKGLRPVTGLLIGSLAALAATYGSYYLRKAIAENGLKEPFPGVAEDLLGLAGGIAVMK